jgi:hypothetical protein
MSGLNEKIVLEGEALKNVSNEVEEIVVRELTDLKG